MFMWKNLWKPSSLGEFARWSWSCHTQFTLASITHKISVKSAGSSECPSKQPVRITCESRRHWHWSITTNGAGLSHVRFFQQPWRPQHSAINSCQGSHISWILKQKPWQIPKKHETNLPWIDLLWFTVTPSDPTKSYKIGKSIRIIVIK